MLAIRGSSIRARLTILSLLVSSTALLLACSAFLIYEVVTYPGAMVRNLMTHAQVISANATASILFQDPESATNTLTALRAEPHIECVAIETVDGKAFARYLRDGLAAAPPRPDMSGEEVHFDKDRVTLRHAIVSEGNVVAYLYLQSDLRERSSRVRRYLIITGLILCASLIGGLLIATRLQRNISRPILELVEAARTVTEQNSYQVRVPGDADGELGLLARTFNHMLEQIERQDSELRQAVRARDEFLSVASHELKTPLTPLQLQVQKLQLVASRQSGPGVERVVSGLEVADRQVGRLTKLVDNLLDISRITSHRLKLEYESFDLAVLVRDVANRFRHELGRAGCALTLRADGPVMGSWDRTRLEQVVSNFLSNAAKYGAGQPVEISVDQIHDRARIRVRDQGIGIAPEDQPRIFERFERAVSEHNYAGLGLGLWIVRQIVDALGGKVTVESKIGEGATFTVELPLEPPSTTPAVAGGPVARKVN